MAYEEFVVEDPLGPITFQGEIVADVRHHNNAPGAESWERWTDMVLYRVREGNNPFRYAVHIVGRSVVYHRSGTSCRERSRSPWLRTTVEDLFKSDQDRYDELTPCRVQGCTPADLDDLPSGKTILVESNDHKLLVAKTAMEITKALYAEYGKISVVATKLLQEARRNDHYIKRALSRPRRIGQ